MSLNAQLEQRKVLLARPETTYGVDVIGPNMASNPSPLSTDVLLCSGMDIKQQVSLIERANYSPSLSQDNTGVSRILAQLTFKTEFRASGTLGTPPRIGRLFKACGFQETIIANTAAATISNATTSTAPSAALTSFAAFTKTTAPTLCFDTYRLTVVLGGAAATATWMVTGAGFPDLDPLVLPSTTHTYNTNSALGTIVIGGTVVAPTFTLAGTWVAGEYLELWVGGLRFFYQVVTSDTVTTIATALKTAMLLDGRLVGTNNAAGVITVALSVGAANAPGAGSFLSSAGAQAVTLGSSGAVITLPAAVATNLTAGEYFYVSLLRPGVRYDPVSASVTSLTFYVYVDGTMIPVTGSRGTFTVDGTAGQYPTLSWTFTGLYNDPQAQALPAGLTVETSKPYKVELAALRIWGQANAVASKFSFDIANTVTPMDNINASEGYDEIRITDRKPVAGCDPESYTPNVYNPWTRLRREDATRFHVAVGVRGGVGNIARIQADNVNYSDSAYATRNSVNSFQYNFRAARLTLDGNNECFFHFS